MKFHQKGRSEALDRTGSNSGEDESDTKDGKGSGGGHQDVGGYLQMESTGEEGCLLVSRACDRAAGREREKQV
jgi:hypothetical protein